MLAAFMWGCLFVGLYPYFIYPVIAQVLGAMRPRPVRTHADHQPTITFITAAFNESAFIEANVLNKLAQDYPSEKIDVIVVSDGSDDGTDEIVARIAESDRRVRLIRQVPRQGKTAALNLAVGHARGDVLVFADANSIYRVDAAKHLASCFADPKVGYVTGLMLYTNPDGSLIGDGCSAFMKYENRLRSIETRLGSIVGVDGGIDAIRRALYVPMTADQLPDFVLPLSVVEAGHRVVFEPRAVVMEQALNTASSEYRMRVRVSLRALWALFYKRALFNVFQYGVFSWQLASHKLLRYLSFIPLFLSLVASIALADHGPVYALVAAGHVSVLTLAAGAYLSPGVIGRFGPARYSQYFVLLNVACAVAFKRFLAREKQVLWRPRVG